MEYLTDENYLNVLRNVKEIPIFIKFTASWCGPCHRIQPHFEHLQSQIKNAHFYKVDVDESPRMCERFAIGCMPTFVVVRNGIELDILEGSDKDSLNAIVSKFVE